jgi:hypothetical protein
MYWWAVVAGSAAVIAMAFVAMRVGTPLAGLKFTLAGNVALMLVTGGSVAIERTLEALWTVVDMVQGGRLPLAPRARQVNALVNDVNVQLSAALQKLEGDMKAYQATVPSVSERVNEVLGSIGVVRANLWLAADTLDGATIAKALGKINGGIDAIIAKYPVLTNGTSISDSLDTSLKAATSLQELLVTFESNPGRRLLSIIAGAIIGLGVAFLLGLNVITAVGADGNPAAGPVVPSAPSPWVAITGLVMGLGSTPTHELIRAVQQQKQKQQKAT